jgi:hypothetical protein
MQACCGQWIHPGMLNGSRLLRLAPWWNLGFFVDAHSQA